MLLNKAFVSLFEIAVVRDVLMDTQTVSQVFSKVDPCYPKFVLLVMVAATTEVIEIRLYNFATNNTLHRVMMLRVSK